MGAVRWAIFFLAVIVGALPGVRGWVNVALDRVRNPSPRAMERTAVLVGVLATAYFTFTAFRQERDLFPKTHDEGSYLLQMRMLAQGRLWMPGHELADFFDAFYVITEPVYASKYFPGTALMYVPTIWFGWPTAVLPLVVSGACAGLLYRIITELVDGAAGLLAAVLLASLSWFRMLSIMLMSQTPMLLLGLLMVWAWLRWRKSHRVGWLVALGAFAGWAAITRPADALIYAATVGAGIGVALARSRAPLRRWAVAAGIIVAGAAPFLALQLVFNKGVTGSVAQTPFGYYVERDQPGASFGFHAHDPGREIVSRVAQKRDYYRQSIVPFIERHRLRNTFGRWVGRTDPGKGMFDQPRLGMLVDTTMPFRVLLPIALVGVLGLTDVRRAVLGMTLPLMVLMYVPYTFFLEHYAVVVAPAVILSILLGGRALPDAWPRYAGAIRSSFALGLITLALLSTHEANAVSTLLDRDEAARNRHLTVDETFDSELAKFVHALRDHVQTPAVVLFRYKTGDNIIEEPVYNNDAAWPDDQAVVKAHDLGDARNVEVARYYARRQPDRTFYRFDRASGTLTPLGSATRYLAGLEAAAPPAAPTRPAAGPTATTQP